MPSEDKHKINVWIPESLWKQIESMGYDSPTKATIAAYEALAIHEEKGSNQEALGSNQEEKLPELENQIRDLENSAREKSAEILRLRGVIQEAPDPLELARLQARSEELEKHNLTLKGELEKASKREEKDKEDHRNYMLQVQSLINQKAIEAPGEKKKPFWKFW